MDRVALLVLSLAAFAGTLLCLRHRSPLHLAVVLAAFTLFVGNFFPVATLFVEPLSWRNVVQAPDDDVLAVQREYLAFGVGILCAALVAFVAVGLGPRDRNVEHERSARPDALVAVLIVLGGATLYALFVRQVGFDALSDKDDYAAKYLRAVGLGPLASGMNLMIVGVLWAEAGSVSPRVRLAFRAVALSIVAWSLFVISVRTNVVILALGYGWIACSRRGLTLASLRPGVALLALAGWFGLEFVSLMRGAIKEAGADRAADLLVRNAESSVSAVVGGSEFSHPFLTALEVRLHEHEGELGGASYWNALPALAPLSLVPDRPLALAERFARTHYAEFAEAGGGTAFSLVAEAWWNFGPVGGALLVGFACGALLLLLEAAAARGSGGVLSRAVPYFTFLCVTAHRGESAVLLKQVVVVALPVALVVVLVDLLLPVLSRRNAQLAPARNT